MTGDRVTGERLALFRRPSPRLTDGEVTHIDRLPVEASLAARQHQGYLDVLARLGYALVEVPTADVHPDGVFVEDTLVVVDGHAVLTRPGAPSRQGEVDSVEAVVRDLGLPVAARIEAPGTLDGGDVLVTDRHAFVGRSTRTNEAGIDQLEAALRPHGRTVVPVTVTGCLHLKSAVTALPDGSLIAVPGWVEHAPFTERGYVVRDALERSGGDVLCLGDTVVLPADAHRTAAGLRALGIPVVEVDVSELQKVEAGVTCMSVLVELDAAARS